MRREQRRVWTSIDSLTRDNTLTVALDIADSLRLRARRASSTFLRQRLKEVR